MDDLYGDLFWYLDYNEDGTLDFLELQKGLEELGTIQYLEEEEVGFIGVLIREMLWLGALEGPLAEW